jgi:putative Holliday junction resolvase
VRVGIDVGSVRVGVAVSDPHGLVATPVETVARRPTPRGNAPAAGAEGDAGAEADAWGDLDAPDLVRLAAIVAEREPLEVVVGLPRSLSGGEGPAAAATRTYALRVARRIAPVPVRLVDERLSTVSATRGLRRAGVSSRRGRSVVDQAAAAIILQSALDTERGTGIPPGTTVGPGRR